MAGDTAASTPRSSKTAGDGAEEDVVEAELVEAEPAPPEEVELELVGTSEPGPAPAKVVFVETPTPPRNRGNRGIGTALALLGAVVFSLVFALAVFVLVLVRTPAEFVGAAFGGFVGGAEFWIPVLFFALAFVAVVLLLNRAAWWVHIAASLLVAVVTYFGSIGLLLLVQNVIFMTPAEANAAFVALALDPRVLIAALVAREVSIWIGLAIATRGRRVKARNLERRAAFERELAEKKAEHERAAAATA